LSADAWPQPQIFEALVLGWIEFKKRLHLSAQSRKAWAVDNLFAQRVN
jgi:hypothetical protein